MKVEVTHHAVERYVKRVDPSATEARAEEAIREAFARAGKLRGRSFTGDERWKSLEPPMLLIVKRDTDDGDVVVVTVVGAYEAPAEFPDLYLPEEGQPAVGESALEPEVKAHVVVAVTFKHLRGDREAALNEVARRVTNAASTAEGCVTGLARIVEVGYPTP